LEFSEVEVSELPGFYEDDLRQAWPALVASSKQIRERPSDAPAFLVHLARRVLDFSPRCGADIRAWMEANLVAHRMGSTRLGVETQPFMTGYFEPDISASRTQDLDHTEPARGRPADLVDQPVADGALTFSSARRSPEGGLIPYWSREDIDAGRSAALPLVWLSDAVELFIAQVQGSACLRFEDGSRARLAYAGKNGHPYVSLGKILIQGGLVSAEAMSLETLAACLRDLLNDPAVGRSILYRNPSYVFFRIDHDDPVAGPIGAQGVALTPFRSIAVDRTIWPFGLPFWVSGRFPWGEGKETFRRLMIAQDTGSAIVGPGRGDIFCGSGDEAGRLAGLLRHEVDLYVLTPRVLE
jgi:membrane-bound lytic murein transglycosylase A